MSVGYDRIVVRRFGGPEVLELQHESALPEPGAGDVRVRIEAAGVGFTDTILRRGKYLHYRGGLPVTPGYEFVGLVDKLGAGVIKVALGQRVADMPMNGAYAQYIVARGDHLTVVPPGIDPSVAVEVPLMWATAWQMLTRCARLQRGDAILVVGASGSAGRALAALGLHLGLRVIGTCSEKNFGVVAALGAQPIDYRRRDLVEAVRSAAGGVGVAAAFDAIGGESWRRSWRCLGTGGILVAYGLQDFINGNASAIGALGGFLRLLAIWRIAGKIDGSARETAFYDILKRRQSHCEEYAEDIATLFRLIAAGALPPPPPPEILNLSQAADAHRRIAAGGIPHRLVLQP